MKLVKKQTKTTDIYTIFTYRYIFDENNDIVDLASDIRDLHQFPERLLGSYSAEWQKYNKRAASKLNIDLSEERVKVLVDGLTRFKQIELSEFLVFIEKAIVIDKSPNIKVIKTDLKSYTESLLEL
ncbi:MAG: hypothetical protein ACJAVV_003852 [Alphaproteobacteria bacterium]|jgi:hypothetical protein